MNASVHWSRVVARGAGPTLPQPAQRPGIRVRKTDKESSEVVVKCS